MNENVLEAKKVEVGRLNEQLVKAKCVVIVTYHNLDVAHLNQLRNNLKKAGGKLEISKNTLVRRALDADGFKELDPMLKGPNALITSESDTSALGVLADFVSKNKEMEVKAAVIEGTFCTADKALRLASIGDKNGALSILASALQMPVRSFACVVKAYGESLQK